MVSPTCSVASLLVLLLTAVAATAQPWQPLYRDGRWDREATTWSGEGTSSGRVADGLRITDSSTAAGSGRFYQVKWQADPARGAALEARVRVVSCAADWGVAMMVADGVHEEGLTLFPDRLQLQNAKQTFPLDTSTFHTYRLGVQGADLRLEVDGKLLWEGKGKFTTAAQGTPPRNQCGFGAAASAAQGEAIWEWGQFRSDRPLTPPAPPQVASGLKVTRGDTIEIVPGAHYTSLFKFRDGRLAVGPRRSADAGKTWQSGPSLGTGAFEFPDGEIVSPGFMPEQAADGVFSLPLSRSTDGGRTFTSEKARLSIPEGTGGTGDDGKRYPGPAADHAVVQLRDGSLLMAMYGYFKTDTVLCPAFPPEWKLYKYRTFVMRSTDRGRTWDVRATVAYDPTIGAESFCEADLLALPGGDLLCFMRTGGSGPKYMTPLYCSRSADDGLTWSKPVPIADRGVWPNACRMQSGVLALTYGRPDNWLAFSLDDGNTWTGHQCFYQGPTTSYNSVEEVAPGKLLVVYDRSGLDADGNQAKGVVGTFFEVQKQ